VSGSPFEEVDRARLRAADLFVGGEAARKARQQGVYAAYVLFLFGAVYGFPLIQAVFRTTDSSWLRQQLVTPAALAVAASAAAVVCGFAYWAGHFRGPVVPPLPWIDLVLTSPIDRALAVRRWWRFALVGTSFVGGLAGLVLGAGLSFAEVAGPMAIGAGVFLGAGLGALTARLWLAGQVDGARPAVDRGSLRVQDALRALDIESLRGHSANTSTLAGSAYAGNLRTARLALAPEIRRGRSARLRPGSPFWVLVRRDVLGLRRQPHSLLAGAVLAALGATLLGWAVAEPAVPIVVAVLGLVPLYLGFGALAEGLRLQADNAGSPSLLGVSDRTEALAHLVLPTGLVLVVLGSVNGAVSAGTPSAVLVTVPLTLLLAGGHLLAAFRGAPSLQGGPMGTALWYLQPGTIVVLLSTLLTYAARSGLAVPFAWSVAGIVAVLLWGLVRVRRLTLEHRV
jgi:hypothetical protein